MKNKIIIYVLCDNDEKYSSAQNIYSKYSWAKPILLIYNDYYFVNSFWKQLSEIQGEWETTDMVGTISYSSFKKISLSAFEQFKNKIEKDELFEGEMIKISRDKKIDDIFDDLD